jgi:ankyrin repeat protein
MLALMTAAVMVPLVHTSTGRAAELEATLVLLDSEIDELNTEMAAKLAKRRSVGAELLSVLRSLQAAAEPSPVPVPQEPQEKERRKSKKQQRKHQARKRVTAQELRDAVTQNDVDRLNQLLADGAAVEERNERGNTVLHDAAYYGHEEVLDMLLSAGNPDFFAVGNDEDNTALHSAAANGRVGAARVLVAAARRHGMLDRIIARSVHGHSALDVAVSRPRSDSSSKHEDVVRLLVTEGADVNAQSGLPEYGKPPLYLAAAKGDVSMCRTLLELGADVNQRSVGGFSALHTAAGAGNAGLVELLLHHGAMPHEVGGEENWTPLHRAVGGNSNVDVVKALISAIGVRLGAREARNAIDAKLSVLSKADDEPQESFEARAELSGATPLLLAAMAAPGCAHPACAALPRSTVRTDGSQRQIIQHLIEAGADSHAVSATSGRRAAEFWDWEAD